MSEDRRNQDWRQPKTNFTVRKKYQGLCSNKTWWNILHTFLSFLLGFQWFVRWIFYQGSCCLQLTTFKIFLSLFKTSFSSFFVSFLIVFVLYYLHELYQQQLSIYINFVLQTSANLSLNLLSKGHLSRLALMVITGGLHSLICKPVIFVRFLYFSFWVLSVSVLSVNKWLNKWHEFGKLKTTLAIAWYLAWSRDSSAGIH